MDNSGARKIPTGLLEILACPVCKGALVRDMDSGAVSCTPCGVKYPVRGGIPVMLADEAEKITAIAGAGG